MLNSAYYFLPLQNPEALLRLDQLMPYIRPTSTLESESANLEATWVWISYIYLYTMHV